VSARFVNRTETELWVNSEVACCERVGGGSVLRGEGAYRCGKLPGTFGRSVVPWNSLPSDASA